MVKLSLEPVKFLKGTNPSFNFDNTIYDLKGVVMKINGGIANSADGTHVH